MKRVSDNGLESTVAISSRATSQRLAIADEQDRPRVRERSHGYRLGNMPSDILYSVLRHLDLRTYRRMFEVSPHFNKMFSDFKPVPPEFRANLDMRALYRSMKGGRRDDTLMLERFHCAFANVESMEDLGRVCELMRNPEVETFYLSFLNFGEPVHDFLREMAAALASRPEGCAPLSIDLRDLDYSQQNEDLQSSSPSLAKLRISRFQAGSPEELALIRHMPLLNRLDLHVHSGMPLAEIAEILLSRPREASPLVRLSVINISSELPPMDLSPLVETIGSLNLDYVLLDDWRLSDWKKCETETLEVLADGAQGGENFDQIGDLLQDPVQFKTLVLSVNHEGPYRFRTIDFAGVSDAIESARGLKRLEIKVDSVRVLDQEWLLLAVLKNSEIRYASLPYPAELQRFVDEAMSRDPGKTIVRTTDYSPYEAKFLKLRAKAGSRAPGTT